MISLLGILFQFMGIFNNSALTSLEEGCQRSLFSIKIVSTAIRDHTSNSKSLQVLKLRPFQQIHGLCCSFKNRK